MGDQPTDTDDLRTAALEVLTAVIREPAFTSEYPNLSAAFDASSLRALVDIAWKYQFETDRYPFKRDINELQAHVTKRVREAISPE